MKKRVLLAISIVVILMGILALIPGIKMGEEPWWHAVIKIVIGAAGVWVYFKKVGKTKTALWIIGGLLTIMGAIDLIGILKLGEEPWWHSVIKIVIGLIAFILGVTKMKND